VRSFSICRIKELDEDKCLVSVAPPNITDPNDGFIDPPSLQPLSASDLVCGLDGLTYHPDGRLYIQRNETDNTTYHTLCDFHLGVSSGCLFISTHEQSTTFYAVGDPTLDNMTIHIIHPDGVSWYRFNILSALDYNLNDTTGFTPGPPGDYNLTAYPTSTNCTVPLPDPLPQPITPGISCALPFDGFSAFELWYRPSDNYPGDNTEALTTTGIAESRIYYFLDGNTNTVFDYNGITFEPDPGEAVAATCVSTSPLPTLTCELTGEFFGDPNYFYVDNQCDVTGTSGSGPTHRDLFYNGSILHPRLPNGDCFGYNGADNVYPTTDDYAGTCSGTDGFQEGVSTDNYYTCRYNRIRLKSWQNTIWGGNTDVLSESMLDSLPLQTFDLHNTEVPCSFTVNETNSFFCDALNHSWANYSGVAYPLYYSYNGTSAYTPVPCFNNSRQLPTLCRDVELEYMDGRTVHVRLEGQHLTYTVEGVEQDLSCDIYSTQGQTLASMDMASVLEGYHTKPSASTASTAATPDVNGTYWKTRIRSYVTQVRASLNILHIMDVGDPYAKDAFLCCLADVIRHTLRFIIAYYFEWAKFARSILALPAYFNNISAFPFDLPTFRTSKDELREALCRLACTVTRILPDIFNCSSLQGDMGCGTTAVCATGLLCHIFDVPLLVLEVIVEILETVRSLIRTDEDDINNGLNNADCQSGTPMDCIASVIIYIITKVVFTITQVFRDLAAFFNCFFCGLGNLLGLGDECSPALYDFVASLMDLIDGLTETILKTLIKILISIVSFFIYLFSGSDNAFELALEQVGNIFIYLGEMFLNIGQLFLNFLLKIPVIGTIVKFFVNIVGEICGVIEDMINAFATPDLDIGCPPVDWTTLKKRGVQGTLHWLTKVNPAVQATWDNELPVCRVRMTQLNNTFYEDLTDTDRLDVFFCLFADHWIHTIEPESTVFATVCEQQVLDFYDQRVLWSQLPGRVNRAEVQWCGRMRYAMYQLRTKGGYDYLPENLLDNPLLLVNFGVQMLYGYDVFSQYSSDRTIPLELLNSEEYRNNWAVTGFGTAHLDALAALPSDEARHVALATDDPTMGLELEQYAERMSSVFKFKASALGAAARFWGRLFGQEPLYPAGSVKRTTLPPPSQSILVQFLNYTVRELAKQQVLPPPRMNLSLVTLASGSVRNRQYLHLGTRAMFKDVPIILSQTAVRAYDMGLGSKAMKLGTAIPRQLYAGTLAMLKIMGDVTHGRSNPLSQFWARQHPKESFRYGMQQMSNAFAAPAAHMGRGPGELMALSSRLWSVSPVARSVRAKLSYVASAMVYAIKTAGRADMSSATSLVGTSDLVCEIPFTELCDSCGVLAVPLGTLIMAPTQAANYYRGTNNSDPSFGHGYEAYVHLRELLNDKSIPAEVGDSPDNPVRWPWYDRPQVGILGDTTPNKGRLVNLTSIFWDVVNNLYAVAPAAVTDAAIGGMQQAMYLLDGTIRYVVDFYRALWDARSTKQAIAGTTRLTVSTLTSAGTELISFIIKWFKSCRFREELNGSQKQFSIAEGLGILFLTVLVVALTINLFVPSSAMSILMMITGLFSMSVLVSAPLMISYMYTPSCFPAIPYQTADDIAWAATHTILPTCDWLWSGIITNDTYDNVQCRECENYDDDTGYKAAACFEPSTEEGGVGFQHFGKNIGFTLLQTFPDVVESWNNTNWPVISTLIQSSVVQNFFTGFEAYNASDPISFSVHWSCNYVHTAIPNYYILLPVFQILAVAMPLAMVALTLIYGALVVAYWMMMMGDAAQAATLNLAMRAGKGDATTDESNSALGEIVHMGRALSRQVQMGWIRMRNRHRDLYLRY